MGPEFYNNMEAVNNAIGAEDDKAWMYNNPNAPANAVGVEDAKIAIYNNTFTPSNCVGGSEQGCSPFAVAPRAMFM
ncbi:hypothetical protein GUITHDRAFT_118835 [Guillardia theta CCMP2712]|uniref:Uncharacterized protein n=1 Tax=Guillardia theta (strain CCMP2712) TaxID=905079 RepID=L1IFF8_GUITC|nr:hypothetical protein GUITHDRAFT_118835 [Guillardia theta CCMP2712]EKX34996.1 hypothetical protein GUITHDRAFT_118835 [Guillardia theta CCMP2712]|eukprot:XP_005821976.1 hypothetical protein GUITHDRAFT_118835 [Guillardia theta CCMP2712]